MTTNIVELVKDLPVYLKLEELLKDRQLCAEITAAAELALLSEEPDACKLD